MLLSFLITGKCIIYWNILYSENKKLDQNRTPCPSNQKTWIRSWFPIHSASLTYVLLVVNAFDINILYQFNTQTVLKGTTKTWKWQKSSAPLPNLDPLWKLPCYWFIHDFNFHWACATKRETGRRNYDGEKSKQRWWKVETTMMKVETSMGKSGNYDVEKSKQRKVETTILKSRNYDG